MCEDLPLLDAIVSLDELSAGVLEGTRIDHGSAGRGMTGDLHQLLALPGEIEPWIRD